MFFKLAALGLVVAVANTQEQTERLHITRESKGIILRFTADSIERDAPTLKYGRTAVHLKGKVDIRMPVRQRDADSHRYVVINADEAEFNEQTGDLRLQGNPTVRIAEPGGPRQ